MNAKFFKLFAAIGVVVTSYLTFYAPVQAEDGSLYVLALGDSLTAGYELDPDYAFPVRLEKSLRADGLDVTVVNGGVSGDTSSGGLSRLDWTLGDVPGGKPDLAIVELGANDALRGIEPELTRQNLVAIIQRFKADGVPVLLAGMQAPPNMGADYAVDFDTIYPELAAELGVALYPFFLEGVAADPSLNIGDGMHPNNAGVDVIVSGIAPVVKKLLNQLAN